MTFEEAEQHRVWSLCDQVKVPREWVSWKFDMPYEDWLKINLRANPQNYRFLWNTYEPFDSMIKGEALVHPDFYASVVL